MITKIQKAPLPSFILKNNINSDLVCGVAPISFKTQRANMIAEETKGPSQHSNDDDAKIEDDPPFDVSA